MVLRLHSRVPAALVLCVFAVSAYAQDVSEPTPAPAPAHLAYVDGTVDVVLDGVTEAADPPMMLLEGDMVRTRNGRAEIIFGDGTLLHLAPQSVLEVLAREHLRLTSGRLVVRMSHAAARPYLIDTPASSVRLDAEGEYALTAGDGERLDVFVTRGVATVSDASQWTVRGGQMLSVAAGGRPLIQSFNSARWDEFTRWAFERTNGMSASQSAAQLPYELRPYSAVLDQHGRWDYVAPHGYVWFPSVGGNWRPYYDGSWSFTRYGWTWYGRDRWSWPTHHYGRWDFNGAFWYWIPATAWAPAWVSWSMAPGYVSWAPFGWHKTRWRTDHPAYAPYDTGWRGWTVVPHDRFVPRRNVRAHVIDASRLDDTTRRTIVARAAGAADTVAVPRGSVVAPGAQGSVRQPPTMTPPGGAYRRAPAAAAPSAGRPVSGAGDAARASDGARGSDAALPRSRRPADHPAYAPPASGARERPGSVRTRGDGDTSPRSTRPRERAPATERPAGARSEPGDRPAPRVAPRGDAPRPGTSPTPSSEGAVQRNGGARRGDGAARPAGETPAQAAPPRQGGARRRPGA